MVNDVNRLFFASWNRANPENLDHQDHPVLKEPRVSLDKTEAKEDRAMLDLRARKAHQDPLVPSVLKDHQDRWAPRSVFLHRKRLITHIAP